ncbi:MAG: VTT domain-containing protein, partial [Arenimonas sp.]
MPPKKHWTKFGLLLLILVAIFAFFHYDLGASLNLDNLKSQRAELSAYVDANIWTAIAIYFVVYVLVAALSLPGAAILTLAGGAIFGLLTGLVVVSFASSIGALLAFLSARFVLRDFVVSRFGSRLSAIESGIEKDGAFYLLTLRLVPIFPFFLVNLVMGLTAIKARTFYLFSQVGMLPGTLAFVYAGTQLAKIQSLKDVLSPGLIIAFVILGILPISMRKISQYLASRRVYRGHKKPAKFDYNLIAIGAGSAGLVTTYIGAAIKAKVALIEKHKMGGDCLNTGCVPSKALIRSAKMLHEARNSKKYGIEKFETQFDFADVMQRVQNVVAKVEPHDSVERYTGLGVECFQGDAKIVSPWEVEVNGKRLSACSIVLATGARPL